MQKQKVCVRMIDPEQFAIDTQKSMALIDEICAAALSLGSGGVMNYNNFIQVRDEFKHHIELVAQSYKTVDF